jgi:hypothetical protein
MLCENKFITKNQSSQQNGGIIILGIMPMDTTKYSYFLLNPRKITSKSNNNYCGPPLFSQSIRRSVLKCTCKWWWNICPKFKFDFHFFLCEIYDSWRFILPYILLNECLNMPK